MDTIFQALGSGLTALVPQIGATLFLLALGVTLYKVTTPFDEMRLVRDGVAAGGLVLGGAVVAMAVPLAAVLATTHALLDILVWGSVAVVIQLVVFLVASRLIRDLRGMIEGGNVAAAVLLVGVQIGVALVNAAAMAG